jgi:peptidoglycan/LPS O-acetylase OafA/YrhL
MTTNLSIQNPILKTFYYLDIARGIAAFSVFLHHYNQQFSIFHENIGERLFSYLGTWGVTVFFILSGFCIHWSEISRRKSGMQFNWKSYISRRFYRIYPAFLICLILCSTVGIFVESNLINHVSLQAFFSHITLLSGFDVSRSTAINGVFWTVILEIHFYILYAIFQKHFTGIKRTLQTTIITVFLAVITYLASIYFFDTGVERLTIQKTFLANWWVWCLGALAAEIISSRSKFAFSNFSRRLLLTLSIVFSLALAIVPKDYISHASRFFLPWIVFVIIILLLYENNEVTIFSPLKRLGDISYSLYLFHPLVLLVGTFFSLPQVLHFVVITFSTLVLAVASYKYIELPTKFFGSRIANQYISTAGNK